MWSKVNHSQQKNNYEHQWNLDFGGAEKGSMVKIRTSKSQIFLQESAPSAFKVPTFSQKYI